MTMLTFLGVFNYGLVLIYGLFLSVFIAGGWENRKQRGLVIALCPVFILIQIPGWLLLGEDTVKKLYPLIVHLPLILILIFALKKTAGVCVVSVLTAYLCCQLPRWGDIAVAAVTCSALAGEIAYSLLIGPLFFLLLRYFVKPAHAAMTYSRQSLLLFGSLPAVYYLFDYATTIYSDSLYAGIPALNELIPTALILFYVVFLTAYHHETQERTKAELQSSAQAALLRHAQKEMDALRQAQMQAAQEKARAVNQKAEMSIQTALRNISAVDPDVKTLDDIAKMPTAAKFNDLVQKGVGLEDAFYLANRQAIDAKRTAAAKAAALNGAASRQHLNPVPNGGGELPVEVPRGVVDAYRAMMPDATDAEIRKAYAEEMKSLK